MAKQRVSDFPVEKMDPEMQKEMERCRREGTPRPESSPRSTTLRRQSRGGWTPVRFVPSSRLGLSRESGATLKPEAYLKLGAVS